MRSPASIAAPTLRPPARPSVELRSDAEIRAMRGAGRVVDAALRAAAGACLEGATTADVDAAAAAAIAAADGTPLFLHYPTYEPGEGFPACTCVSVNDEVVHGVPGRRRLAAGDLVKIDCGVRLDGWCADAAISVAVGTLSAATRRLAETTEAILAEAISMIRPGRRWSEIARRMESMAHDAGFGVVEEYVGHGIGRRLHEPPQVPGFLSEGLRRGGDFTLRPGMTLAIEPMLVLGVAETVEGRDGWTVSTADGQPAAHFEHTVAVRRDGAEILTDGR